MANTVWVWKDDGTLQCEGNDGISVEDMQKELEHLGATVLSGEKRQHCRFITTVCGAPTGQVNAYEISEDDWEKIKSGIVGPLGFRLWDCPEAGLGRKGTALESRMEKTLDDGLIPWPWAQITSVAKTPCLLRDIIGRPCRCYHQGDALTKDYRPERVNIELDKNDRIVDIWFG